MGYGTGAPLQDAGHRPQPQQSQNITSNQPSHNAIENLLCYCSSDYLTLDGINIRCVMKFFGPSDRLPHGSILFIVSALHASKSNIGHCWIFGWVVSRCNEQCPNSVIKFLMTTECDVICLCCSADYMWDKSGCKHEIERGLPLHLYLSCTQNLDIGIVKDMIKQYPDQMYQHRNEVFNREDALECSKLPTLPSILSKVPTKCCDW